MDLFIAKTFTSSLKRLQVGERESVLKAAEMYRMNPAHPGLKKHRLDKCRDLRFWSVRCTQEIRAILHESKHGTLFCYVDHHDPAYNWAEKRKLASNPTTGAMQVVEIRELFVPEVRSQSAVAAQAQQPRLFANLPTSEFAWLGVPADWIENVRTVRSEDELLELITHLPEEAGESLLTLAGGGTPRPSRKAARDVNPFRTPDAARRFYAVESQHDLRAAITEPWSDWRIFLHPTQRECVEAVYNGDARICGGPGTGKTVVALHRAVFIVRQDATARVLLTTISRALAASLAQLVQRLAGACSPLLERIKVMSIDTVPAMLLGEHGADLTVAEESQVREALAQAGRSLNLTHYSSDFLFEEWGQVIEACSINDGDAYRALARSERLVRLTRKQKGEVWQIISHATALLNKRKLMPPFRQIRKVADLLSQEKLTKPFDYIITDECQDLRHEHLVLLNAMRKTQQSLFFTGDLGQRIRQPLTSWKSAGIDVTGRCHVLKVNYRTSHQIRSLADRLVPGQLRDMDGMIEDRRHTISVFSGIAPSIREYTTKEDELLGVAHWFGQLFQVGVQPHECCVFVRDSNSLPQAKAAIELTDATPVLLDHGEIAVKGQIALATMPYAEGLEFRAVAIIACDAWTVPLQSRLNGAMHEADTSDILLMEQQMLYVATTRARDFLVVTGTNPLSQFIEALQ